MPLPSPEESPAPLDPGGGLLAGLTPAPCSLSFQDMTDYVAYVAKDPINQRGEVPVGAAGGPRARPTDAP